MDDPTAEYLRDLAARLMAVPCKYGVDQGDVDRLQEIATDMREAVPDAKAEE